MSLQAFRLGGCVPRALLAGIVVVAFAFAVAIGLNAIRTPEQKIADGLLSLPGTGRLFETIRRTYPQEFDQIVTMAARSQKNQEPVAAAGAAMTAYILTQSRAHLPDLAQAPHARLATVYQASVRMMARLQQINAYACAEMFTKGSTHVPPDPQTTELGRDLNIATLEASAAGRDTPVRRSLAKLSSAEWDALLLAMSTDGMTPEQRNAYEQDAVVGLPDDSQCSLGLHFFRTMSTMPAGLADRIFAVIMTHQP